jgi:hypothetical protein
MISHGRKIGLLPECKEYEQWHGDDVQVLDAAPAPRSRVSGGAPEFCGAHDAVSDPPRKMPGKHMGLLLYALDIGQPRLDGEDHRGARLTMPHRLDDTAAGAVARSAG